MNAINLVKLTKIFQASLPAGSDSEGGIRADAETAESAVRDRLHSDALTDALDRIPRPDRTRIDDVLTTFLATPEADRMLRLPMYDTDMVDFEIPQGEVPQPRSSPKGQTQTNGLAHSGLVWNLAENAVSYPAFSQHPAIRAEFAKSLSKRTRLWEPLLTLLATEFKHRPTPADVQIMSGWFTMVHLSAPIDQIVDGDPMSDHWRGLGGAGAIQLVLALKDEVLRAPLAALDPQADVHASRAVAAATVELASACLTASIGEYLDIVGYSELRDRPPYPLKTAARTVLFYEQLVGWKSSVIYECLLRCAALTMHAPDRAVEALAAFGDHVGFAVQVLDDAGGVWGGGDDLEKEPVKITSPLAYALSVDHPDRDELVDLVHTPSATRDTGRIREILDTLQARAFLEFIIRDRISRGLAALTDVVPALAAPFERWADAYFRRTS